MKKTTNKGFTLVELIIVITILAILATIAFVSFQGYAADSRDTKRKSEVANLKDILEVKTAEGVSVLSLVTPTAGATPSSLDIGGETKDQASFSGGTLNFAAIGADNTKYSNNGADYAFGAHNVGGGAYQLASKLEKDGTAYVMGSYNPRTDSSTSATGTLDTTKKVITLSGSTAGLFRAGDIIKGSTSGTGKISSISSDLTKITITYTTAPVGNVFTLNKSESGGLVLGKNTSGTTGLITNGGTFLPQ